MYGEFRRIIKSGSENLNKTLVISQEAPKTILYTLCRDTKAPENGKPRSWRPRKDAHVFEYSWSHSLAQLRGTRGY
jgi:hypothetical protein